MSTRFVFLFFSILTACNVFAASTDKFANSITGAALQGGLTPGVGQYDRIDPISDEDWLKLDITPGVPYIITVDNVGVDLDISLELYDEAGNRLFKSNDGLSEENEYISYAGFQENIGYYVRITQSAIFGGDTNYSVALTLDESSFSGEIQHSINVGGETIGTNRIEATDKTVSITFDVYADSSTSLPISDTNVFSIQIDDDIKGCTSTEDNRCSYELSSDLDVTSPAQISILTQYHMPGLSAPLEDNFLLVISPAPPATIKPINYSVDNKQIKVPAAGEIQYEVRDTLAKLVAEGVVVEVSEPSVWCGDTSLNVCPLSTDANGQVTVSVPSDVGTYPLTLTADNIAFSFDIIAEQEHAKPNEIKQLQPVVDTVAIFDELKYQVLDISGESVAEGVIVELLQPPSNAWCLSPDGQPNHCQFPTDDSGQISIFIPPEPADASYELRLQLLDDPTVIHREPITVIGVKLPITSFASTTPVNHDKDAFFAVIKETGSSNTYYTVSNAVSEDGCVNIFLPQLLTPASTVDIRLSVKNIVSPYLPQILLVVMLGPETFQVISSCTIDPQQFLTQLQTPSSCMTFETAQDDWKHLSFPSIPKAYFNPVTPLFIGYFAEDNDLIYTNRPLCIGVTNQ